jgi:hypothetical protein
VTDRSDCWNRVMHNGTVSCRWHYSGSGTGTWYSGFVTKFQNGAFDLVFTDHTGTTHCFGDVIFRQPWTKSSSLYLPKYVIPPTTSSPDQTSPTGWTPYFLPAIPLNYEHLKLFESFRECLSHASDILRVDSPQFHHIQRDILSPHLYYYPSKSSHSIPCSIRSTQAGMASVYRSILPLVKLIDLSLISEQSPEDDGDWIEAQRNQRKLRRKQMEESSRCEKLTWRDVYCTVMWKAKENI